MAKNHQSWKLLHPKPVAADRQYDHWKRLDEKRAREEKRAKDKSAKKGKP
jgi:hypothetical protein